MGALSGLFLGIVSGLCVPWLSDHCSRQAVQSTLESAKVLELETNSPETETQKAYTEYDKPDRNDK